MSFPQDNDDDHNDQPTFSRYINGSYYTVPKNLKTYDKNELECDFNGTPGFHGGRKGFHGFTSIESRVPHLMGKTLFPHITSLTSRLVHAGPANVRLIIFVYVQCCNLC